MNEVLSYLGRLSEGVQYTLLLTFAAFAIGALLGVLVAAARVSRFRPIRLLGIGYVEVARGVPPVAWLFLLYFGLAQIDFRIESLPAAIVGLGLISAAYLAEIYRAGLRAVPIGQFEAARAIGLGAKHVYS